MFQHTQAIKEETRKLLHTINSAISDDPIPNSNLNIIFDKMWPELEKSIENMPSPDRVVEAKRSPDEMIAEILELSRAAANNRKQTEWVDQYVPMLKQFFPFLEQITKNVQTTSQLPPQVRARFEIKIRGQKDIKRIEGTAAIEEASGTLLIMDGSRVIARIDGEKVERWSKESSVSQKNVRKTAASQD